MAFQNPGKKYFSASDTKYTATTATTATAYTPTTGRKIYILGYKISSDTAQTVSLLFTSTTFDVFYVAANGGANNSGSFPYAISPNPSDTFRVTTSAAGNCTVTIWGYEE